MVMDPRTFAQKTLAEGGASRHAFTEEEPPSQGYMVGGARTRSGDVFADHTIEAHKFNEHHVQGHARRIQEAFDSDDGVYQGSWVKGGNVIMDASNYLSHRLTAKTMARQRGQEAIYDLGSGKDVQTSPGTHKAGSHRGTPSLNPFRPKTGGAHRAEGKHAAGAHKAGKHRAR